MRVLPTVVRRVPVLLGLTGVLLLLLGALVPMASRESKRAGGVAGDAAPRGPGLEAGIAAAQQRLREVPGDWTTWAELGSAYVQQARVTADPGWYSKAEGALRRSLELEPTANWPAMVGMGSLANARHDFHAGLDWGRRAQRVNPAAGAVDGVLADALTQLGDYPAARDATQHMLNTSPGVASFTRASYDFEEHGQVASARTALVQALRDATDPADAAFCRYYLGELAFNGGDLAEAITQYQAGIAADPAYRLLYAGLAKARAAAGDLGSAAGEYGQVVQALPLPQLFIEYGDTLTAAGQPAAAAAQYDLVLVEQRLMASNGVVDHLTAATFLADHGHPVEALREAEAEWAARHSVLAADALAWALYRNGRSAEALSYAGLAAALGWRNATFQYHRGMIHQALGHASAARSDLGAALAVNPYFDILQAPAARAALAALGSSRLGGSR